MSDNTISILALIVSGLALGVSIFTAWHTFVKKGELRMSQPTTIYFGPDSPSIPGEKLHSKVYLRTLLYSTSRRGQTIESLYVTVQRGETRQNFPIWVYGDKDLHRGSGLFVPAEGIISNHHFLLPQDGSDFLFLTGDYTLRINAKSVGSASPKQLALLRLQISESQARKLQEENAGIYFDLGPDDQTYHAHIR